MVLPWDSAEMVFSLVHGSGTPNFPYFEGSLKSLVIFGPVTICTKCATYQPVPPISLYWIKNMNTVLDDNGVNVSGATCRTAKEEVSGLYFSPSDREKVTSIFQNLLNVSCFLITSQSQVS